MKDNEHPFFRPLWRRIAVVALCVFWTAIEFYNGDQLWLTITAGMTLYAVYVYLWAYRPPPLAAEPAPESVVEPVTPAAKEKE